MPENNLAQNGVDESVNEFPDIVRPITREYQRACNAAREQMPLNPPTDLPDDFNVDDYDKHTGKFTTGDYKLFVEHFMGNNLLSEGDLENRIKYLRRLFMNGDFKNIFLSGRKFWLIPIPIDGNGYSKKEIPSLNIAVLNYCTVEGDGLTRGFTPTPAYYYPDYPKNLRACSFNIPNYSNETPYPTDEEFNKIITGFTNAYHRLMEMGF